MFYEIGVLAVLGTLLTVGVLGMVGYSARDVEKSENFGQPLFATYILLRGTATVCQRVSRVLDMALMLGMAKFGKKTVAKATPLFARPSAASPPKPSPSPAKAGLSNDIAAEATEALEIATVATRNILDTALVDELFASSSSAPACPSLPDSPVAVLLPQTSDPAVEAMLAAVPRRRRAFPKSNP
jgi:hypothetical protein